MRSTVVVCPPGGFELDRVSHGWHSEAEVAGNGRTEITKVREKSSVSRFLSGQPAG